MRWSWGTGARRRDRLARFSLLREFADCNGLTVVAPSPDWDDLFPVLTAGDAHPDLVLRGTWRSRPCGVASVLVRPVSATPLWGRAPDVVLLVFAVGVAGAELSFGGSRPFVDVGPDGMVGELPAATGGIDRTFRVALQDAVFDGLLRPGDRATFGMDAVVVVTDWAASTATVEVLSERLDCAAATAAVALENGR